MLPSPKLVADRAWSLILFKYEITPFKPSPVPVTTVCIVLAKDRILLIISSIPVPLASSDASLVAADITSFNEEALPALVIQL